MRIEKMIAPASSSSAAPLRPITVMPMGCQCMECAPQLVMKAPSQPVAAPAPSIESAKSNVSPGLNVVASEAGSSQDSASFGSEQAADKQPAPTTTGEQPKDASSTDSSQEMTQEEKAQLAKLRARDREVRAHEQAHAAAGAGVAGAPSYSYQQGPDGKQYAVGGEVSVKTTASSSNPRQAIAQLQQVARAALAPASPSGQDRAVAASARAQAAQLQAQLAQEAQAKAQEAMQRTAESTQATSEPTGTPAPTKPLLPELPEIAKPAAGTGTESNTAGAVQPIAPSVVTPPEKKSTNNAFGGSQSADSGIAGEDFGGMIAAYQQSSGSKNGGNQIKPLTPSLGGIISLNT